MQQGGLAAAYIRKEAFTPKTYPIVNFDYRFPPDIELALLLYSTTHTRYFSVGPTAECKKYQSAGVAPGIVADGKWRHAQFDLYKLLQEGMPDAADESLRYRIIGDWGPNNNSPGMTYYLDNFAMTAPGSAQPAFTWRAVDATGIAAHSYVLDRSPDTVPDEQPEGAEGKSALPELIEPGQFAFCPLLSARSFSRTGPCPLSRFVVESLVAIGGGRRSTLGSGLGRADGSRRRRRRPRCFRSTTADSC